VIASVTFAVAFFIGGMMLVARHVGNESFIGRYNKGVYEVETEGSMLRPNIPDGYVPLYNLGNVYYKNGDYEQAAAFYYTALEKDPPEIDEECRIRINLALALLHQVDFEDLDTRQKVNRAITHLKAARGVLTEHGCANEKDSKGHSKDAEKLKKDIDEMLRKLEKEGKSKPDEEVTPPPKKKKQEEKQNSSSSARERNLQNELQKNQKENMKQREQKQRMQQESGGDDPYGGGSSGEDPSGSSVSPYATKNW
jgi:tetratricopeptide (TPR) repeat protein